MSGRSLDCGGNNDECSSLTSTVRRKILSNAKLRFNTATASKLEVGSEEDGSGSEEFLTSEERGVTVTISGPKHMRFDSDVGMVFAATVLMIDERDKGLGSQAAKTYTPQY